MKAFALKGSLFSLLILLSSFLLKKDKITLYIIGDSTAANKEAKFYPETGWGMKLQNFFNNDVLIDNRALNGRSTKSFLTENRWQPIVDQLKAGDYVFIEFGHNDEKINKPGTGTTLEEFKINLIKYVNETRSKKANPILLTPVMRRSFINGVFQDSHVGYPAVTRRVADSLNVPLIDMHKKTERLILSLGEEKAKSLFNYVDSGHVNYPKGKKDDTHFSPYGAQTMAELVVEGIKEQKLGLIKKLKTK
ncbi:rhamnogalacturonan acetylesterase [Desertivirga brevis]|uniref:rhamnogalacturonan acetylesterase n=1 Tax=Desertivirga brevis TaxID=2810310 RepID=UPI001A97A760|nr:rhamnogalacturonan acetylesterase [Pedobacter sp. SYSU D00873]